jgi:hypothetical protein
MGFERQELRQIRTELEKAIDTHQQIKMAQNGDLNKYVFDVGNCSYNDSTATFQLKVTIKGAKSEERVALERNADYCGLDLDKDHPEWILVGYNRKARGYPILMKKKSNGKTYKFDLENARKLFGKEVA